MSRPEAVILDTDAASRGIRDRLPPRAQTVLVGARQATTFVTVGELRVWTRLRDLSARRQGAMAEWLRQVVVLPVDPAVAITWGDLQANARLRGRPRPINDTWIAACCLVHGLPLVTFNTKDFADFAEHDGLQLVGL